jgi:hypothetical protein
VKYHYCPNINNEAMRKTKPSQKKSGKRVGKSLKSKANNQRNKVVERAKHTGFHITETGRFVRE